MSSDDFDYYADEEEGQNEPGAEGAAVGEGVGRPGLRDWLNARRGWILIICLALVQGIFAVIMLTLRSEGRAVGRDEEQRILALAVDMLGHEVDIRQIHQLVPMRGGKRMTIGLDIALVLGQLPEEQIEGAARPTPEEFELFLAAVKDMEPRIRSQVNILLQRIPPAEYGTVEVYSVIKNDVQNYVNDSLERLDFGAGVRPEINKRRVTDVLLPMFVRQYM